MPTEPAERPRRARMVRGGPLMIDGPVELVDFDGNVIQCDRFQVAVCMCRRSKRYPLCDTSHRPKKSQQ
ncbi:CDGSH iron-sulfur domain-containing protein [Allokutzneria albata]|uniref:Iron-binding zinc finger CDGSH type n=1 Tax=Allokutzneria albata TaxID=211114 RepID=A0A1G9TRA1_ALLAB|nr:Iron-binding zinc finger CDGSH type [Allokutzneria albata]